MFASLINRLRQEIAFRRDLAEVTSMDDRQLADIGVTRFDLAMALREGRRDGAASDEKQSGYLHHRAA